MGLEEYLVWGFHAFRPTKRRIANENRLGHVADKKEGHENRTRNHHLFVRFHLMPSNQVPADGDTDGTEYNKGLIYVW